MEFYSPLRGEGHAALGTGVEEREGIAPLRGDAGTRIFSIRRITGIFFFF